MKISSNELGSAVAYFKKELTSFYDKNEVDSMLYIFFEHFFGVTRTDFLLHQDRKLSESDLLLVIYGVKDLKKHKPLAYIIGEWEFFGLSFYVNEHVLIPRPETEELVQLIINDYDENPPKNILDIGSGSGCIALSLKHHFKGTNVTAWDVSDEVLKVIDRNAKNLQLEIKINKVDALSNPEVNVKYDVIVSNPPYIMNKEQDQMHSNVLDYEPHLALFVPDENPLLFYEKIADIAVKHLTENGTLYVEINEQFGDEVVSLFNKKGFEKVEIIKDINNKNRMVKAVLT
ncbi:MAG: peptide chain release factor N(5)-glutamine methyltransferase [Flavobacteriales bacterium]|nr:peptide chain release factor N(5)-glutamine methyltransferase [Flavobacteriales bacterium]MCW8914069.1 peptide chain release factor N(5)-glutamine methyltransferase [Flavobacteriales bacterium]MCW8938127.1 peptide chain release factor N(5)-glutamine methyltransferase [Flavobacteriales bacterium]MCW8939376.1 peptide chain release factor N(5)-glutamine methyltransferase [Flavobacteriales bacterium]MCW8968903.1 peptide chain release factor N(5)-glutamine methyltransferase [Flavobacteriales bact